MANPLTEPTPSSRERRWPPWTSLALILSGVIVMIVETPNLLFFVGLGFVIAGLYVWLEQRAIDRR